MRKHPRPVRTLPPAATALRRSFLLAALAAFVLSFVPAVQAARAPAVKLTWFPHLPSRVEYFEDSSSVLWHDSKQGRVYRSSDEGASWDAIPTIPAGQAKLLVLHPYDKTAAYVLGAGTEHWRTADAGVTWKAWNSPVPPDLSAIPLNFNADYARWDDIIFIGSSCTRDWIGDKCTPAVRCYTHKPLLSSVQFFSEGMDLWY